MQRRARIVAAFVAVQALATGAPAEANWLSTQWRWTHKTNDYCVKNYAELSHGSSWPGGTHQSAVEVWYKADTPFGSYDCMQIEQARLKARVRAWSWDGDEWLVCRDSTTQQFPADHRQAVWLRFGRAPCGKTAYTTDGSGHAYVNGTWEGGWVQLWNYSDPWYHWLPDAG